MYMFVTGRVKGLVKVLVKGLVMDSTPTLPWPVGQEGLLHKLFNYFKSFLETKAQQGGSTVLPKSIQ